MFCHALCVAEVMRSTEQSEVCGWEATRKAAKRKKGKRRFKNSSTHLVSAQKERPFHEIYFHKIAKELFNPK